MAQQEKFEFYYTFQGTEFGNEISSFHSIFFIVFCPRKPFCAPCVGSARKKPPVKPIPMFRVVSGCGQIGRISCTMATLETGQDPLYEASEHREETLQRRKETSQRHRDASQLVGTHRNS